VRVPIRQPESDGLRSGVHGKLVALGKYDRLGRFLAAADSDVQTLAFDQVDLLVGGLPASAGLHRQWWENEVNGQHVQAHAWIDVGWRVAEVDLASGTVTFSRQ
jgi:putative restriction endonuclease